MSFCRCFIQCTFMCLAQKSLRLTSAELSPVSHGLGSPLGPTCSWRIDIGPLDPAWSARVSHYQAFSGCGTAVPVWPANSCQATGALETKLCLFSTLWTIYRLTVVLFSLERLPSSGPVAKASSGHFTACVVLRLRVSLRGGMDSFLKSTKTCHCLLLIYILQ